MTGDGPPGFKFRLDEKAGTWYNLKKALLLAAACLLADSCWLDENGRCHTAAAAGAHQAKRPKITIKQKEFTK